MKFIEILTCLQNQMNKQKHHVGSNCKMIRVISKTLEHVKFYDDLYLREYV